MDKQQWLIEAKYLIHDNAPDASAAHVDDLADGLYSAHSELDPDEAVAMYLAFVHSGSIGSVLENWNRNPTDHAA